MKRLLVILIPVFSLIYWYFFLRFIPLPPLQISREVTYFTDIQKQPDGRISLAPSVNRMFAVKPQENAALEMLQIYGLQSVATDPARIEEFCRILEIDAAQFASPSLVLPDLDSADGSQFTMSDKMNNYYQILWQEDEHPEFAAIIRNNSQTFTLLEQMAGKKALFWPVLAAESVWNSHLPRSWRPFQLCRMLLARGMNHLANSRLESAWNDIFTSCRIARVVSARSDVLTGLFSLIIVKDASFCAVELLKHPEISELQLQKIINDIAQVSIFSAVCNAVAFEQRFFMLSMLLEEIGSVSDMASVSGSANLGGIDLDKYFDRSLLCRKVNQVADELTAVMNRTDIKDRLLGLEQFRQKIKLSRKFETSDLMLEALWIKFFTPSTNKTSRISEVIWKVLFAIAQPDNVSIVKEAMAVDELPRLVKAAALLRLQQIQTGQFPENLKDLKNVEKSLLTDSFTGDFFRFLPASAGITLYSIGPNLQDDGGMITDNMGAGDLVIQLPAGR